MNSPSETPATPLDLTATWGSPAEIAVCEICDWTFVMTPGSLPRRCPHCFRGELSRLESPADILPRLHPPELILPFTVSEAAIEQAIQSFAQGNWFAPPDLKPQNLRARLQRVYLPVWLVDGQVEATWKAEAGFDYEAISHQSHYADGSGWNEQTVTEKRVRWESRLGRLRRAYSNVMAPAVEEHASLMRELGNFPVEKSQPATPPAYASIAVRLPNRSPQDAWSDALPAFQAAAAAECQQAAAAQHIRAYSWSPTFDQLNWTLLLLPVLTSYYLDDDKQPVAVMLHGMSGRLSGRRRASWKRAQTAALWIGAAAVVIFLLSLLMAVLSIVFPLSLLASAAGILIALVMGVCALLPLVIAWNVNRRRS